MKVILCTHRFVPPFTGGVDVYTDRLGRALQRLGHEVSIIAFDPTAAGNSEGISASPDDCNNIRVWRVKFSFERRPSEYFDYAYDPEMGTVAKTILQKQQPDIVIILNFYMITLAVVEVAKDLRIPVVHIATDFIPVCRRATFVRWDGRSCQTGESIKSCSACFVSNRTLGRMASRILNTLPDDTLIKWANKPAFSKFPHPLVVLKPYWRQVAIMEQRLKILGPLREKIDLVLAPNQYIMNTFLANGFRSNQVYFLPFSVEIDNPLANIKQISAANTRFLFIGRLQPYKGAHLLVEAFNNLPSPKGATLTIYGVPDGHEAYFSQLNAMMASNKRIRFAGQIASADLFKAFAEADFFILPSLWHENSPLILLDSLQSKTPIIASNIGGVTDLIEDGVNGLLFPMGDKLALQKLMQRVIDQPDLKDKLSLGAKLPRIDDYAATVIRLCQERLLVPKAESLKALS